MANLIPLVIADVELQLATSIAVGGTSFTLASAKDDDGNDLPAGQYCFTVDSGTSNKEYLMGQLNGTEVTGVSRISRQGAATSGAGKAHRVGAPVILTNFAALQRVADILRGQITLDSANPIKYDGEPTLSENEELATVGYVLDAVSGESDLTFSQQVLTGVSAGETVAAGDLLYLKTSDQEWYKTDADTASTVNGVQLGIALGAGSDGVAISGGVLISGVYTTSDLTAGSTYYASNTAGEYGTSAGTTQRAVGVALSTSKLLLVPVHPLSLSGDTIDAFAGGGNLGTPSGDNKFLTEDAVDTDTFKGPTVQVFDTPNVTNIGSATTRFDITKSGSTVRYTFNGTGTNPSITSSNPATGSVVYINGTSFASGNNGLFTVTASGTNYFEIENASGTAENDKSIGDRGQIQFSAPTTWTKPAGLKSIVVEVQGGGGGGKGASGAFLSQAGSAGGYARKLYAASDLSATEGVHVGLAGTTQGSSNNGLSGGFSKFKALFAGGGRGGGMEASGSTFSAGGGATGGDVNVVGGYGGWSGFSQSASNGGNSVLGIGGAMATNGNSASATGYGAGGAGGYNGSGSNGSQGIVIITEYYS